MSSQEAGAGNPQRSWRPGPSRKAKKSARNAQLAFGVTLLALIVGGIVYLLGLSGSSGVPPLTFLAIGRTDYADSGLPPNAGAREDVLAFNELFQQIHLKNDKVRSAGDTERTLVRSKLPGVLKAAASEPGTLFVFCSLHSEVIPEKDEQGEHAELLLLLDGKAEPEYQITLHELIDSLASGMGNRDHVILALDATTAPTWARGILSAKLEDLIASDVAHPPKRLTIVCATSGFEESASLPVAAEAVPGWKNRPGTVFGNALYRAFSGEADVAGSDNVLQVGELLDHVRGASAVWNQTVVWYPAEVPRSLPLMVVGDVGPPTAPEAKAEVASAGKQAAKTEPGKAGTEGKSESYDEQLRGLWSRRDNLAKSTNLQPATWRLLNRQLVQIEQIMLHELHERQSDAQAGTRERLDELIARCRTRFDELDPKDSDGVERLPLIAWHHTSASGDPIVPDDIAKLLAAIVAADGAKEAPQADPELPSLKDENVRVQLGQALLAQVCDRSMSPGEYADAWQKVVAAALRVFGNEQSGPYRWRPERWPAEFVFLKTVLERVPVAKLDAQNRQHDVLRNLMIQQTVSNRFGSLLGSKYLRPEIQGDRIVQEKLSRHEVAMLAAEQWLFAGDFGRCESWNTEAGNALTAATDRAELILQTLLLRDTLELRLPEHARWVANDMEYQGLELGESVSGKNLRNLFRQLGSIITQIPEEEQEVRLLLDEATAALKSVEVELASLVAKCTDGVDQWPQIPYLLRYPWLNSGQRAGLIEAFRDRKTGGDIRRTHGWQAYWCERALDASTEGATGVMDPPTGLEIAKLGERFRSQWASQDEGDALDAESAMRRSRKQLLTKLRTRIAGMWLQRGVPETAAAFVVPFESARADMSDLDLRQARPPVLNLAEKVGEGWRPISNLARAMDGGAKPLRISWDTERASQRMGIVLKSNAVRWSGSDGSVVKTIDSGDEVKLQLDGSQGSDVLLALAPADDPVRADRALSFRRFRLAPKFNKSGWHVVFLQPKGSKRLTQFEKMGLFRSDEPRRQYDEPWINPGQKTTVRLELVRPIAGPAASMQVQLMLDGDPTGFAAAVEFKEGETSARLDLKAGAGESKKKLDVSNGAVFRVTPAAEQDRPFDLYVRPWIRGPRSMLTADDPTCRVGVNGDVEIRFRRRIEQGTLPESLDVRLDIGQKLRKALSDKSKPPFLTGALSEAQSPTYRFRFDALQDGGEITTSIGLAPAFVWRAEDGRFVLLNSNGRRRSAIDADEPSLRITSPADGLVLNKAEECPPVRVRFLADYNAYRNAEPNLRVQVRVDGVGLKIPDDDRPLWSGLRAQKRVMSMEIGDKLVALEGQTPAMVLALGKALQERGDGKHNVEAVLQRVGTDGSATEIYRDSIDIMVDASPPTITWQFTSREVTDASPLKMNFLAVDEHSGIRPGSVFVRVTGPAGFDQRVSVQESVNVTATRDTFAESGDYQFVLEATNKAGIKAFSEKKTITITLPPKAESPEDK